MKHSFTHPRLTILTIVPGQLISTSAETFQAEISGYGSDTGGGFKQDE